MIVLKRSITIFTTFAVLSLIQLSTFTAQAHIEIKTTNTSQQSEIKEQFERLVKESVQLKEKKKSAEAEFKLGEMLVGGYTASFKENFNEAAKHYIMAADQGLSDAKIRLIDLYDVYKHLSDEEKANLTFTLNRSDMKLLCLSIVMNTEESLHHGEAYWRLVKLSTEDKEAKEYAKKAASLKHVEATRELAKYYYSQWHKPTLQRKNQKLMSSKKKAILWNEKSEQLGDPTSYFRLGKLYKNIKFVATEDHQDNLKTAFGYFMKGAGHQDPKCTYLMGLMSEIGYGTEKNLDVAIDCYLVAAKSGITDAQNKLKQRAIDWENSEVGQLKFIKGSYLTANTRSIEIGNFCLAEEAASLILESDEAKTLNGSVKLKFGIKKKRTESLEKTPHGLSEISRRLSTPNVEQLDLY